MAVKATPNLSETYGLSAGSQSCALTISAVAYCWGSTAGGRIGNGTNGTPSMYTVPTQVSQGAIPATETIKSISGAYGTVCATVSDGKAYCWGVNDYNQAGTGSPGTLIVPTAALPGAIPGGVKLINTQVGEYHSCALGSNAKVYCWGRNNNGQLGNGNVTNSPVAVEVLPGTIPANVTINNLYVKGRHNCVLASDAKAYCWGYGLGGNLGNGGSGDSTTPAAVSAPGGVTFKSLSSGASSHTSGVATDGWAYCWGGNANGEHGKGDQSSTPTPVAILRGAIPSNVTIDTIETGYVNTCAIGSNGKVYCWGWNGDGELGLGYTSTNSTTPAATTLGSIPANESIKTIRVGSYHICAVSAINKAYCWDSNGAGQIGNNTSGSNVLAPAAVSLNLNYRLQTYNTFGQTIY